VQVCSALSYARELEEGEVVAVKEVTFVYGPTEARKQSCGWQFTNTTLRTGQHNPVHVHEH
jgi:hypothetical protein